MSDEWAFADWLRRELDERGWTQSELARRAGVTPEAVSAWVRGVRPPSRDSRAEIARALGVPRNALPPRGPGRRGRAGREA